jgi:hypothetical protein
MEPVVMQHDAFRVGDRFWTATAEWQCTDIGTHTIVAVKIAANTMKDAYHLSEPPYSIAEYCFDEYDLDGCYPSAAERDADLSD